MYMVSDHHNKYLHTLYLLIYNKQVNLNWKNKGQVFDNKYSGFNNG